MKVSINNLINLNLHQFLRKKAFKANLTAMAYNYCKLKPEQNHSLNILEIKKSIRNLKMENTIIITKPDKGNG